MRPHVKETEDSQKERHQFQNHSNDKTNVDHRLAKANVLHLEMRLGREEDHSGGSADTDDKP